MGRFWWTLEAKTVYEEHQPMLRIMQLFGLAPFVVSERKPRKTRLQALFFFLHSGVLFYCIYDTKSRNVFKHTSTYTLTALAYDILGLTGSIYTVLIHARYLLKARHCMRIWQNLSDVSEELSAVAGNVHARKTASLARTAVFLIAFSAFSFFTFRLQTNKSKLTGTFWAIWYLPLFQRCLAGYSFGLYCWELKRKYSIVNGILAKDVEDTSRLSPQKVRILRRIHILGYEVCKELDVIHGLQFFYVFVTDFINGTLDMCNILRLCGASNPSSVVRFKSAVYWMILQVVEVFGIVFSGVFLRKEVRIRPMFFTAFQKPSNAYSRFRG